MIATASELFEARHYPGVVAMISDALEHDPDCVELLVIRARAHIALRRELDAQSDLRDIIRLDPACSVAYRLLGELAARRDENESAAIFFREAIRLNPGDADAREWLAIVDVSLRPAAAVKKLPAPAAAAGRFPLTRAPVERGRTGASLDRSPRTLSAPGRTAARPGTQPRFARGTHPPDQDERPTKPFGRGSERAADMWKTPAPQIHERTMDLASDVAAPYVHDQRDRTVDLDDELEDIAQSATTGPRERTMDVDADIAAAYGSAPSRIPQTPLPLPPPPTFSPRGTGLPPPMRKADAKPIVTIPGRPPTHPPAPPTKIPAPRAITRAPIPELPGFGEYLVTSGILSRERLRAAQAYQRSMKVQLSTAIVTLGLATPQRIEWAAVSHQSTLGRSH